ncbi:PREDICTED: T-cell surface antigen CD2 [Odobenus rosmarus divergens]|uniref:T-cell surface antigen CD2 n=1 Tax=Odobenus rosmarus divergens TaxID=9708 RepID=A0A2U3WYI3_ODORO|nr:PREDICTED: T-cell surface antigen CD2 [Odobenus rosmarus divergens]
MSLACQILASFLLIFIVSTKGAAPENNVVWGTLGQDFNLNITGFQMNDDIDDIRWEKGKIKVARLKMGKLKETDKRYNVSTNGALKIKHLKIEDSDSYRVVIYATNGKNILDKTFLLKIQEEVSLPVMFWSCTNRNLTCEIRSGTDPELMLYLDNTLLDNAASKTISRVIATNKWTTKRRMSFNCTAKNKVSKQNRRETIDCSEKGLDLYLIVGICGGGIIFIIFMTLLIFYINKRKKQNSRRNDEELEIRTRRVTTKERRQKPRQFPGSAPQNPAVSQAPPPPSHRPQVPCHRSPPPSHRVQHHPQKKAPPPSATHVHQQKGPPLPRPRVQPKPPHGAQKTHNSVS